MARTKVAESAFADMTGFTDTFNSVSASGGVCGGDSASSASDCRWTGAGTFTANQYAKIAIATKPSANQEIGLSARDTSASGTRNCYIVTTDCVSYNATVKFLSENYTELGTGAAGTWNTNDTVEMEVEGANDATIRFFHNGVEQFSDTDASIDSGGTCGINFWKNSARGDNWEAGNLTTGVNGSVAQTLAATSAAITGTVAVASVVSQTLAAVTPAVTAAVGVTAAVAQTAADTTGAITGTVAVAGALTQTLADATLVASATVATPAASADLDQTLSDVQILSTGTVSVSADLVQTLEAIGLAADTTVAVAVECAQTLAETTLTATATVTSPGTVSGELTQTLAEVTGAMSATVAVAADVQQGLADATLSAAATVAIAGDLSQTLADSALAATGTVTEAGTVSAEVVQTLADATLDATAEVGDAATVESTLAATTLAADGTVAVAADVAQTLAATTLTATATGGANKFTLSASENIAANAATATTAQLTAPAGKTANNFGAATIADDTNPLPSLDLTANQYTELEWSLAASAGVVDGEVYTFRVTANGTELDTYSVSPTWTIGETVANATVNQTLAGVSAAITALARNVFQLSPSAYIAANAANATTGQLTPPSGKSVNAYFQAGRIADDTNPLPSLDLVVNCYTELEWSLVAGPTASGTYSFRVTANGTALDSYLATPTWMVAESVNATVAQTLADATIVAEGVVQDPGTAIVNQTLQDVTGVITGSSGRAADVTATLDNVSETKLAMDTSGLTEGDPTGFNFYFGRVSGVWTDVVDYPYPATETVLVTAVAPDTGEWYVMVRAYNLGGESDNSNVVFVVVPTCTATVETVTGVGVVTQTLQGVSCAFIGKVGVTGTVSRTLAATTIAATATVETHAAVTQTLGTTTGNIPGTVAVAAELDQTLGTTTISATAGFETAEADVTQTLQEVTLEATGSVYEPGSATAWVDALLESVQVSMNGTVAVSAEVDATLAELVGAITGHAGAFRRAQHNVLLDGSELTWPS